MQVDTQAIDRIVTRVLHQLRANGSGAPVGVAAEESVRHEAMPKDPGTRSIAIPAHVITADVLTAAANGAAQVTVPERAIVTPAAWDAAKQRRIVIVRDVDQPAKPVKGAAQGDRVLSSAPLMIVVRNTDAVARLCDDLKTAWRRELLGCPDDAAALAISAISRGEAASVVILAAQSHRAACLANRNERIKAATVRDAGDVRTVQSQLRANVWCIDPADRSWFELRNMLRAIVAPGGAS